MKNSLTIVFIITCLFSYGQSREKIDQEMFDKYRDTVIFTNNTDAIIEKKDTIDALYIVICDERGYLKKINNVVVVKVSRIKYPVRMNKHIVRTDEGEYFINGEKVDLFAIKTKNEIYIK